MDLPLLIVVVFALLGLLYYVQERKVREYLEQQKKVLQVVRRINRIILEELDYELVTQKIADAIPLEMHFATGVLAIYDEERKTIRRIAASRTKEAEDAIKAIKIPFRQIEISVDDPHNLMARSIRENKSFMSNDVYDVLGPVLNREEAAEIQRIMKTKTTLVYPVYMNGKSLGVFIASTTKPKEKLLQYELDVLSDFVNGAAIALQHATLYKNVKAKTELLSIANSRLKELDQEKDDFVSLASHELRTPMTAIRSYAWMALYKADIHLSEKMTKYLSRVVISTERMINLVNEMLNISRIEARRINIVPKVFNVKDLIDEMVLEVDPKIKEKSITFYVLGSRLPQVIADPDKVYQVILNIIGNALKFTPEKGGIVVTFSNDHRYLQVHIKDTGPGILPEDMSKLFTKFGRLDYSYTATATSGGTGLGLFISKKLMNLMGGDLTAFSEGKGKGATFTFSLPLATQENIRQSHLYTHQNEGQSAKGLEPVDISK